MQCAIRAVKQRRWSSENKCGQMELLALRRMRPRRLHGIKDPQDAPYHT